MNSKTSIFLDTSIQTRRFFASVTERIAIENHLADCTLPLITSRYVFMEFQRSVLSDYIHVYNQVLRHRPWEAVAQAIQQGERGHRPRSLGRCLQILTQTMALSRLDYDHALQFLQAQIRMQSIQVYLSHHPRAIKEQTQVMQLIQEILLDPRQALGQSACWRLGDVIILLQVPSNATLWTVDKDFIALCAALGVERYSDFE